MILERIELCHVGRFVDRVQAGPFDPGLNILAAPNEQGKSTLVRAAARCLFDRHTTRADEIKCMQPAGTDLAPEVTVEFRSAQRRYQLRKRFLQNPESNLAEWRDEIWRSMAAGDAADQRVFEMLVSAQPGRGASKPEHWGLLRYLWARQDEPALWPEWNGDSGDRIRRCLAKLQVDPGMDRVLTELRDECDSVFTATGQVKKGGELFAVEVQLKQLDAEVSDARNRIQAVESQQDSYRQLGLELVQVRQLAETSRAEAERLREQLNSLALARQEIAAASEQFQQANDRLQVVDADAKRLAALRNVIKEAGPAQEALRERLKGIAAREDDLHLRRREADEAWVGLDQERVQLADRSARLRTLAKRRELEDQFAVKQAKLAKINAFAGDLNAKQLARTRVPVLTNKQLDSFRGLERERRELEIHLQAAGLQIELIPEAPAIVRAETDRGSADLAADKLAPAVVHARRRARIELPGWGAISISSGAQELKGLEAKLETATEQLESLRERLGVTSADHAEQSFHLGKELDGEIKLLGKQLQNLLEEHESASAFATALAALESKLAAVANQLGTIQPEERNATLIELESRVADSEAAARALETRIKHTAALRQDLESHMKNLLRERAEAQTRAADIKGELERSEAQIVSIAQRYAEGIDLARVAAQESFVRADARLAVSKAKLPADADLLPWRRDRAARAAADAEQSHQAKRAEMSRLEGALGNAAAAGLFSQLAELEERAASVRARLATLRRRGQAARFLCELIQRRKAAAVRTVLGPLEKRLSASFADLSGEHQRSVFLDEDLAILGVGRSREPRELIAFQNLSQGAREQLLLCLRAAAAVELAAIEPQALILDDVLVNTDAVRQTKVLDFLTNLAERVQLVVLTCHPERYAGIGRSLSISPVAL